MSAHTEAIHPDNSDQSNYEEVYMSDSQSDSDTSLVDIIDGVQESYEISCKESFIDQLESSDTGIPHSSSIIATGEVTSVPDTADVASSISSLERAEDLSQNESVTEGIVNQRSEHDTVPISPENTENNVHIVPVTRTCNQHCMLHTWNRTLEEGRTHTDEASSLSTDQCKSNVTCHMSVLHPEIHKTVRLFLCETFQKYSIESDVSQLIASEAVRALEEELRGVLRGKLLNRVLNKVTRLVPDSETDSEVKVKTDEEASSQTLQLMTEISEEWKQKLLKYLAVASVGTEQNTEQVNVEDRTQLHSDHTRAAHVQVGGLVDKAVQTVSTGSVLFLKLQFDS